MLHLRDALNEEHKPKQVCFQKQIVLIISRSARKAEINYPTGKRKGKEGKKKGSERVDRILFRAENKTNKIEVKRISIKGKQWERIKNNGKEYKEVTSTI